MTGYKRPSHLSGTALVQQTRFVEMQDLSYLRKQSSPERSSASSGCVLCAKVESSLFVWLAMPHEHRFSMALTCYIDVRCMLSSLHAFRLCHSIPLALLMRWPPTHSYLKPTEQSIGSPPHRSQCSTSHSTQQRLAAAPLLCRVALPPLHKHLSYPTQPACIQSICVMQGGRSLSLFLLQPACWVWAGVHACLPRRGRR